MQLCYVDELGDLGTLPTTPAPTGNDQPVFVRTGILVDAGRLESLTNDFLVRKYQYFPGLPYPSVTRILSINYTLCFPILRRSHHVRDMIQTCLPLVP